MLCTSATCCCAIFAGPLRSSETLACWACCLPIDSMPLFLAFNSLLLIATSLSLKVGGGAEGHWNAEHAVCQSSLPHSFLLLRHLCH